MYYNKTYHISDYLNVQDMNDLVDKVKNLIEEMSTGKNLFSGWTKGKGILSTNGTIFVNANGAISDFIPVDFTKNPNYYVSGLTSNLSSFVGAYNSNKEFLGRTSGTARTSAGLKNNSFASGTPQGTGDIAYIVIYQYKQSVDSGSIDDLDNMPTQLEIGRQPTSYEPYMQILPPSHYDLDLPTYELNDFVFVEDIDKIERNIMNIGYDFFQPPGYIQNKIWRDWYETDVYKSFGADDLNRMITDMNLLYEYYQKWYSGELRFPIYNLYSDENWDGDTTLEWE